LVNRTVPAHSTASPDAPSTTAVRRTLPPGSALGRFDAPIGPLTLAVTPVGLARLAFGPPSEIAEMVDVPDEAAPFAEHPLGAQVIAQLTEYFAGDRRDFELPLDWTLTGGAQRTILQTLYASVPYGRTVEYGELAVMSGRTVGASRLVGTVMGSNPIAIVVPCHRVVAADGLGGFGGGLETKRRLLTLEGVLQETLFDL
jgi:methylated-DNA-[protein]-cysteine S-methyltransferase